MADGLTETITFKTDLAQKDEIERARRIIRVDRSAFLRLAAREYARSLFLGASATDSRNTTDTDSRPAAEA